MDYSLKLYNKIRINNKKNLSQTITFLLFTYTLFYIKMEPKEKLGWEKIQTFRQKNVFYL